MEYLPAAGLLLIAIFAIPLSIIDIREHRLPNKYTYPAMGLSIASVLLAGFFIADPLRLAVALITGLATFGIGYLLAKFNGIGMGDVKLLTAINPAIAWFSPFAVLIILAIGFTLASMTSLLLIALGKANLKTALAMGPFLLLGFLAVTIDLAVGEITVAGGS